MNEGSKQSEYSKNLISKTMQGKIPQNFEKCIIPHQFKKGHEVSDLCKEKVRITAIKSKGIPKKNGRTIAQGYIMILLPSHPRTKRSYVFEHILVVEKFIGRYLHPNEVVHHIDRNKMNNNIDNLMVFQSNAEHLKFHTKMRQYRYITNPMRRQIENRWKEFNKK